jgi:restriction system protein
MAMAAKWKTYQNDAAAFFRSIGLTASTDATVKGVRTSHDVDVLVNFDHVGFDVTWIVECKLWKSRVSKLHVLALREIVADIGADRGIILSEKGFQSGAIEAAALTNVQVTSLADLKISATPHIYAAQLHDLFNRVTTCKERYWDIPKEHRIQFGLRPEVPSIGYSGATVIELANDLLSQAMRGQFPFRAESLGAMIDKNLPKTFVSAQEVFTEVEPRIRLVEQKLDHYDAAQKKGKRVIS